MEDGRSGKPDRHSPTSYSSSCHQCSSQCGVRQAEHERTEQANEFAQVWLVWGGLLCESSPVRPRFKVWRVLGADVQQRLRPRVSHPVGSVAASLGARRVFVQRSTTRRRVDVNWAERVVAC